MKGKLKRKSKILSPQAITGCLDVLVKAHAQIALHDANLAEEITEAIGTIMQACNRVENVEEDVDVQSEKDTDQFKQMHSEIIEDIFTGEILYKGLK